MPETPSGITIWEATAVPISRDVEVIITCRAVIVVAGRRVVVATAEDLWLSSSLAQDTRLTGLASLEPRTQFPLEAQ